MNINLILKWMSFCFPTYLLISDVHGTCKTLLSSIQLIFSWLNYKNELWNQDLQWTLTLYVTNLYWFAFWVNNFYVFAIYFCRFFLPWKCQISSVFFFDFLKKFQKWQSSSVNMIFSWMLTGNAMGWVASFLLSDNNNDLHRKLWWE